MAIQIRTDIASYWLDRAATALDCAVQCCGTKHSEEINELEKRCDELVKELKKIGN